MQISLFGFVTAAVVFAWQAQAQRVINAGNCNITVVGNDNSIRNIVCNYQSATQFDFSIFGRFSDLQLGALISQAEQYADLGDVSLDFLLSANENIFISTVRWEFLDHDFTPVFYFRDGSLESITYQAVEIKWNREKCASELERLSEFFVKRYGIKPEPYESEEKVMGETRHESGEIFPFTNVNLDLKTNHTSLVHQNKFIESCSFMIGLFVP